MKQLNERIAYIDNLRVLLTVLVILLHLAITYGGPGLWEYMECRADTPTFVLFAVFNAVNQSFLMGFFFLIAGYFAADSYDRKGPRRFTKDRLLRLGVPLLIFDIWIIPTTRFLVDRYAQNNSQPYLDSILSFWKHRFHIGNSHMWFVEQLLLLTLLYVLCRLVYRGTVSRSATGAVTGPGFRAILIFALLSGMALFIKRIHLPLLDNIKIYTIDCPLLPVHYVFYFIFGIMAYRRQWFESIQRPTVLYAGGLFIFLVLIYFPIMLVAGGALSGSVEEYYGGWHIQSLAYAVWDQLTGACVIVLLLNLFRSDFNRSYFLTDVMARSSYATYIFHGIVIISVALAMRDLKMIPIVKFLLSAVISVPLAFLTGFLLRKLPLAKRIL